MIRLHRRRALAAALCAGLLPAAAVGAAQPLQLLYERSLMSAAGARCGLFTPDVAGALAAAVRQSRGAALRGGADLATVAETQSRARTAAAAVTCRSSDLALAAGRVRSAFSGYARMNSMDFPGDAAGWKATRGVNAATSSAWRLAQVAATPAGRMVFGVAADSGGDRLTAAAGWRGSLGASGARLVVRDARKFPEPYLDTRRKDLEGRVPPRSSSLVFLASGRAAAAPNVLPTGATGGAVFRFPPAAIDALEALDPREALVVEVVYSTRTGERVERALFEVGDFAAALAFLEVGR